MTPEELTAEHQRILSEHKGVLVVVEGLDGYVLVKPLTMDVLNDRTVISELKALGTVLDGMIERNLTRGVDITASDVVDALGAALPMLGRTLQHCVDRPLEAIDLAFMPGIVEAFVAQNFTGPRLKPWAGLLQRYLPALAKRRGQPSTLATGSRPSSTMDTTTGGSTPATNSSSGSGGA